MNQPSGVDIVAWTIALFVCACGSGDSSGAAGGADTTTTTPAGAGSAAVSGGSTAQAGHAGAASAGRSGSASPTSAGAGRGGSPSTTRSGAGGTTLVSAAGSGGTSAGSAPGGASGSAGTSSSAGAGAAGTAGGGAMAGACSIPKLDSSKPPQTLMLSGNLGTHDPSAIFADGTYYLFATGNGIATKTSKDLKAWTATPDVFSRLPSWVASQVSGVTNVWAPDISFFGGVYHLYYAVSTFGSNKSCIGHATRASLSSGSWSDQGSVICSNAAGKSDDWNAIDPNVIVDETGTPWLDFGSFWSGIKMVKLDDSGKRADDQILALASNKSIEGPYIIHQCDYYYLFVSFGSCCGDPYDYNIRVGRSKSVTGPYMDKDGKAMMNGGGTQIVKGNDTITAPGHNAVLVTANGTYNIYHALNASHGNASLRIAELVLDADGWPVSGGP